MKVAEIFTSINGEGTKTGETAVFIRFQGCNLNCSFCDTKWANETTCPVTEMTPQDIYETVVSKNIKNITITGGEPLIQKELPALLALLGSNKDLSVEIETNGSIDIYPFCNIKTAFGNYRPTFTLDYKLPQSGCENKMFIGNYNYLEQNDTIKFVVSNEIDLERSKEIITEYNLTNKCHIYLSPVFGAISPQKIVEFMLKNKLNDIKLQLQLHKIIWDPDMRGV